jgi:hypothetical protein
MGLSRLLQSLAKLASPSCCSCRNFYLALDQGSRPNLTKYGSIMSLEPALAIVNVSFLKASNTYENGILITFVLQCLVFSIMAPNLAPSQHDVIRAMILNKKLKTYEMANVAKLGAVSVQYSSSLRHDKSSSKWWRPRLCHWLMYDNSYIEK